MTTIDTNTKSRLFFVDLMKAISITAVVSFHSLVVPRSTYTDSASLIDILFSPLRFCVPVLLTISFMLFERGLSKDSAIPQTSIIKKRLTRLAVPTVFWFSLVAGLKILNGNSTTEIVIEIFKGEIFTGAYYLLILFQLIPLYIWMRHWLNKFRNVLLLVAIQILIFKLTYLGLSMKDEPQLSTLLINLGRVPFIYWFVYAALGGFSYKNLSALLKISSLISVKNKVFMLANTYLILIVNYNFLSQITNGSTEPFEYITLSNILGTITLVLCLSSVEETQLPIFLIKAVKLLSKYCLGIFCLNGIFYLFLLSLSTHLLQNTVFDFTHILLLKVCGWVLLLVVSLSLSILMSKIGLKKMVC
ncbi:MAG: acyltransferase family protein [Heteroscytonema crispum UTEX LB 1556]